MICAQGEYNSPDRTKNLLVWIQRGARYALKSITLDLNYHLDLSANMGPRWNHTSFMLEYFFGAVRDWTSQPLINTLKNQHKALTYPMIWTRLFNLFSSSKRHLNMLICYQNLHKFSEIFSAISIIFKIPFSSYLRRSLNGKNTERKIFHFRK